MGEPLPTRVFLTVQGQAFVEALAARSQGSRAMALREALAQIVQLNQTIERWEAEMEKISKDVEGVETLAREIPGVGRVLAATILGETGPVQRFASPKALGRFTGLTPEDRSTGGEQIRAADLDLRF
jgi:transposase